MANEQPAFLFYRTSLRKAYDKSFHFRISNVAIQFFWVSKIFQENENLVQLPFTQKFYQKISRSVYDSIFIDTAMDLLIN